MLRNVGKADCAIRLILGALLAFMAFTPSIDGWLATVFYVIAGYLVLSALIGHCLFFRMLDIDSHQHAGTYHTGE